MRLLVVIAAAGCLAACAGPVTLPDIFAPSVPMPASSLEERLLKQARDLSKQERWPEAAVQWEILQLLRPDEPEYARQWESCQLRARQVAAQQLRAAGAASERKDADQAMVSYLKALRMEPGNAAAMEGLRAIEKQRAAMSSSARNARANGNSKNNRGQAPVRPRPEPYGSARQDLDVGIMLFRQGDYAASIQSLERYLRGETRDETARRYLADAHLQLAQQHLRAGRKEEALAGMEKAKGLKGRETGDLAESIRALHASLAEEYYQKGVRAYYADIGEAIAQWERGLRHDPAHPLMNARLKEARKAQQKMRALDRPGAP